MMAFYIIGEPPFPVTALSVVVVSVQVKYLLLQIPGLRVGTGKTVGSSCIGTPVDYISY